MKGTKFRNRNIGILGDWVPERILQIGRIRIGTTFGKSMVIDFIMICACRHRWKYTFYELDMPRVIEFMVNGIKANICIV